jgi:Uma2 family endonuclease
MDNQSEEGEAMSTVTFIEPTHEPFVTVPAVPSDALYEVVDGQMVEVAVGALQSLTASELQPRLHAFARNHGLGRAVMETLFDLTDQVGRKRRPDVAFVSYQRWPREQPVPEVEGWPVVPNLAVEIVSPTNRFEDVTAKMKEYFRAGVERVWVILPAPQEAYVYDSPRQVSIVTRSDKLVGAPILPGFELPLGELFETPPAPPV